MAKKLTFKSFVASRQSFEPGSDGFCAELVDMYYGDETKFLRIYKYPVNDMEAYIIIEKADRFVYAWPHPCDQHMPTLAQAERAIWDEFLSN